MTNEGIHSGEGSIEQQIKMAEGQLEAGVTRSQEGVEVPADEASVEGAGIAEKVYKFKNDVEEIRDKAGTQFGLILAGSGGLAGVLALAVERANDWPMGASGFWLSIGAMGALFAAIDKVDAKMSQYRRGKKYEESLRGGNEQSV